MYTVYVLYSEKFNKHYTGFSSDFENRIKSHNELGNKDWTTKYRPWKMIYTEEFSDKSQAMKKEKWLKSGVGREFIKKLDH
jgi:putative endonuclease